MTSLFYTSTFKTAERAELESIRFRNIPQRLALIFLERAVSFYQYEAGYWLICKGQGESYSMKPTDVEARNEAE